MNKMNQIMKRIFAKKTSPIFLALVVSFLAIPVSAGVISQEDPKEMVLSLSQMLMVKIDAQRPALEADPEAVKAFSKEYVLPYIDTAKMARYVMGKYWRTASDVQKKAFTATFSDMLIRSYSKALLTLKISEVSVKPAKEVKKGVVTVASIVVQEDGSKTDVVYRAYLNRKTSQWFLYDISIEGISMLLNYRKSYGSEFSKKGLDKVIAEMEIKNGSVQQSAPIEVAPVENAPKGVE